MEHVIGEGLLDAFLKLSYTSRKNNIYRVWKLNAITETEKMNPKSTVNPTCPAATTTTKSCLKPK